MIVIANMDIYYYDVLIVCIASFFDVVLTFYTLFLDARRPKRSFQELNPLGILIMRWTNNGPLGLLIMGLFAQAVLWSAGLFGAGMIYPFFQGVYFVILWTHIHNIRSLYRAIRKDKQKF